MAIPERFTFVTGPINISNQCIMKNVQKFAMLHSQGKSCHISKIISILEKVSHNDELLGDLESIHRTLMLYL
ncbi:P-loop containing nucleoside triphosphate hydrolase protein [Gigaspora margarita]|uniref:P-loop containing nucleoside triphosphate hydrolase protein n=1 Tax=Gigaspora margarita TaxID=4874 RepID=A0A8H3X7E6_GIGMA|nr:P-loop containing nucleoside triphosphate hydrolase protein [Gigaspora margarita]